ncbi:MAG TPA: MarR family transcriptional regulator [Acidimicrobiales bacterium]|nr:MarR family transcriptional regulator [Acidimicrobiales bacterium]
MPTKGSSWMVRASERHGDAEPTLEELVGLLFQLTGDLRQRFTERSAEFDLSFAQALALRELDEPIPMRDLADRLCCDASNVTGIVDRLESRGLVERRTASDDRRVKQLVLTEAGRQLEREHRQGLIVDLPLLDDLSADERRQLAELLRASVGERRTTSRP